jgi:hypothetical protein
MNDAKEYDELVEVVARDICLMVIKDHWFISGAKKLGGFCAQEQRDSAHINAKTAIRAIQDWMRWSTSLGMPEIDAPVTIPKPEQNTR